MRTAHPIYPENPDFPTMMQARFSNAPSTRPPPLGGRSRGVAQLGAGSGSAVRRRDSGIGINGKNGITRLRSPRMSTPRVLDRSWRQLVRGSPRAVAATGGHPRVRPLRRADRRELWPYRDHDRRAPARPVRRRVGALMTTPLWEWMTRRARWLAGWPSTACPSSGSPGGSVARRAPSAAARGIAPEVASRGNRPDLRLPGRALQISSATGARTVDLGPRPVGQGDRKGLEMDGFADHQGRWVAS